MVRRTKAEALETRQHIIEAARQTFAERGVSRTSLEQVAAVAGVTRGAIYWHFANKTELFHAMREDAALPLFGRMDEALLEEDIDDPLRAVEESLLEIVAGLESDERLRDAFAIMVLKCEYVGEFREELGRIVEQGREWSGKLARTYECARRRGLLRPGLEPQALGLESQIFMFGLVRLWLMDEGEGEIRRRARAIVVSHVATRRA